MATSSVCYTLIDDLLEQYDLTAQVTLRVAPGIDLAYVTFGFDSGQFRLGSTRALLDDIQVLYRDAQHQRPELPRLSDWVFFDIPDPLGPEDLAWMLDTARQLGVDLVVRQG